MEQAEIWDYLILIFPKFNLNKFLRNFTAPLMTIFRDSMHMHVVD